MLSVQIRQQVLRFPHRECAHLCVEFLEHFFYFGIYFKIYCDLFKLLKIMYKDSIEIKKYIIFQLT